MSLSTWISISHTHSLGLCVYNPKAIVQKKAAPWSSLASPTSHNDELKVGLVRILVSKTKVGLAWWLGSSGHLLHRPDNWVWSPELSVEGKKKTYSSSPASCESQTLWEHPPPPNSLSLHTTHKQNTFILIFSLTHIHTKKSNE